MSKVKVALIVLPVLAVIVLIAVFWKDICLCISHVGTTLVFVVMAFVVGWLLGFANARRRYNR